ncbi:hypothetical protein HK101_002159, partial [Irineochytrium annulatum]
MHAAHAWQTNPTPPSTPPHSQSGPQGGWGHQQQAALNPGGGWGQNGGLSAPMTRSRATSDVGNNKPSWDSVPGWSTAAAAAASKNAMNAISSAGWNAPPAQPQTTGWASAQSTPAAQFQQQRSANDGWNRSVPSSSSTTWGPPTVAALPPATQPAGGWNPIGWAPLPPVNPPSAPVAWDGKRPGSATSTDAASAAPQQRAAPPSVIDTSAVAVGGPRWAPDVNVSGPGSEDFKKEVRKAKSTPGLDRKMPNGNQNNGPRAPLNHLGPKGPAAPRGGPPSRASHDDMNAAKKEEGRRDPMRLFNRSFAEVNKSLGLTSPEEEVKVVRRTDRQTTRVSEKDKAKAIGVYVYGFPKWVRVREIIGIFADFGDIVNVAIVSKPKKDQRAYAYVDYETVGSASKAMDALRNKHFFDMTEPLELRPHFDRNGGMESGRSEEKKSEEAEKRVQAAVAVPRKSEGKENAPAKAVSIDPKAEPALLDYKTIHIGNVPQSVDKSELEKLFHTFGEIRRIHVVQRPTEKRAFAFVSFKVAQSAREALNAIKDTRHFGMNEPLKAEYSRADHRERSRTKVTEKPAKSAAAATIATAGVATGSKTVSKANVEKSKERKERVGRTVIFVRDVKPEAREDVKAKFVAVGPVKSFHVLPRIDSADHFAIVVFEKSDDASKAVKEKVEAAVFPRQRRLTVQDIPKASSETELKEWFAKVGEVRRVEMVKAEKAVAEAAEAATDAANELQTAEVEFVKGDAAILGLLRVVEVTFGEQKLRAAYSPSKKDGKDEDHEHDHDRSTVADADAEGEQEPSSASVESKPSMEDLKEKRGSVQTDASAEGEVVVHTHAGGDDYFGSSSEDEDVEVVEVVTLEDLGVPQDEVVTLADLTAPQDAVVTLKALAAAEDEVVTLQDLAASQDEVVTLKDLAAPKDEIVTLKDLATPQDEVVTLKDLAAPQDEIVTLKDLAAPVDEIVTLKDLATSHDENVTLEDLKAAHEEVSATAG